ncbi:MAG: tetratricopeptide repeat protein [Magnetococcales bacterium]|nr:tetratricopeptide repeat protein [Magnetococcales bacterium]
MNRQEIPQDNDKPALTVDVAYSRAVDHFYGQRYTEADKLCTAIIQAVPNHIDSINLLGVIAQKINRHDLAVKQFKTALELDNNRALLHHNIGISQQQLGDINKAVQSLKTAHGLEPDNSEITTCLNIFLDIATQQSDADELLQKGLTFFNTGKFDEAIFNYQKAIVIKPNFAQALSNLGVVLQHCGNIEQAIDSLKKAVAIKPNYADAHCNLGVALQNQGRLDEASISYQQAIAIDANHLQAIYNLGFVMQLCGNLNVAVNCYKKVISINPDNIEAYSNLGVALQDSGKPDEAFVWLRKAVLTNREFPTDLRNLGESLLKQYGIDSEVTIPKDHKSDKSYKENQAEELLTKYQIAPMHKSLPKSPYCYESMLKEFAKDNRAGLGSDKLRILLLQPPNWKIPSPGQEPFPTSQGGDPTRRAEDISLDATSTTYGLLSIAAQLLASKRKVLISNISDFTWQNVEQLIGSIDFDLVGLTCMTHNLRGVAAITTLIRKLKPNAHIVAGGTHATALPKETLQHFKAVDTVVIGEGEDTFLNIVENMESNKPIEGIAGTAWRDEQNRVQIATFRNRIDDLDKLASPHDYFSLHLLITSRGCPFRCTFCGSEIQWGSKLKMNSAEHVLQQLDNIVNKNQIKSLAIKDDTFTAIRKRTIQICQQIVKRGINFIWSCDTRVNSLDEEVLRAMRMAGCQQISVGVESGSEEILKTIKKKLIPKRVIEVTKMARKYGLQVRFYLIVGNRGENLGTFQNSVQLIHDARPSQFFISHLTLTPGTEEFDIFQKENNISSEIFFDKEYDVNLYGFNDNMTVKDRNITNLWLNCYHNKLTTQYYTVAQSEKILSRLDGLHSAHVDLAGACIRAKQPEKATTHIAKAIKKGYPLPEVIFNYLACIAAFNGNFTKTGEYLKKANDLSRSPYIIENYKRYQNFIKNPSASELKLIAHNDFLAAYEDIQQPYRPGH